MSFEHPHPQPRVKHQKVFVSVSPGDLPVDLLSIQHRIITKQALTIGDAETALERVDKELGAVLKLAQVLADCLAVFSPGEPALQDLENFLENGIDGIDS